MAPAALEAARNSRRVFGVASGRALADELGESWLARSSRIAFLSGVKVFANRLLVTSTGDLRVGDRLAYVEICESGDRLAYVKPASRGTALPR